MNPGICEHLTKVLAMTFPVQPAELSLINALVN